MTPRAITNAKPAKPRTPAAVAKRKPPPKPPTKTKPPPTKPRARGTPSSIKPAAVDPLATQVNAQFDPAFKALERQRLTSQADRDASLRDRRLFDDWAKADRERRTNFLRTGFESSQRDLTAARQQSDATISGAIERAMTRVGGLGGDALRAAGLSDAVGGAKTTQGIADAEAKRIAEITSGYMERADAQSRVDRAYGDTLDARAKASYGRRQSELDQAQLGLEQNKAKSLTDLRSADAKAKADAIDKAWNRAYLTGKQEDADELARLRLDLQARGQDITMRGQDIQAQTADENRAARLAPQAGAYKGRNAGQYKKLYDSWLGRATAALKPKKGKSPEDAAANRQLAFAEAGRQMSAMVAAGVRPKDAVKAIEAATGGNLLSVGDYQLFLLRHLPKRNVDVILGEMFGSYVAPSAGVPRAVTPDRAEPRRAPAPAPKLIWRKNPVGPGRIRYVQLPDGRIIPYKPPKKG